MRAAIGALLAAGALFAADQGRPSPPLTILRESGPPITLKQYQGKIVMLAFIQTPSMECQSLLQLLSPIARDYAPRGVQVLVVAFDESAAGIVPKLTQRFDPPFPVGWTSPNSARVYFQDAEEEPRNFPIPRLVFLDRQGVIRRDYPGDKPLFKNPAANIRSELDKILR